jgi:hypothetical protein
VTTHDEAYDELYVYSMSRGATFVLQHVVDAHAAQTATADDKPIRIVFGDSSGLYLHVERGLTGRQVQLAHIQLGKTKRPVARDSTADRRGNMTARDVLATPEGDERDRAIDEWCDRLVRIRREPRDHRGARAREPGVAPAPESDRLRPTKHPE